MFFWMWTALVCSEQSAARWISVYTLQWLETSALSSYRAPDLCLRNRLKESGMPFCAWTKRWKWSKTVITWRLEEGGKSLKKDEVNSGEVEKSKFESGNWACSSKVSASANVTWTSYKLGSLPRALFHLLTSPAVQMAGAAIPPALWSSQSEGQARHLSARWW